MSRLFDRDQANRLAGDGATIVITRSPSAPKTPAGCDFVILTRQGCKIRFPRNTVVPQVNHWN
jgi:hypothetical protein